MLHIRLLGAFLITYNHEPLVGLTRPQLKTLLAYLVLHRNVPLSRTALRKHFWQSTVDEQPTANLRNLLHYLRHELPVLDNCIDFGKALTWKADAPCHLDVAEFEAALHQANVATAVAQQQAALAQALTLYTGDLWPACRDEWIIPERERLHKLYIGAVEQLISLLEWQRDYTAALQTAQRLLRDTPLREESYRRVMHLYAALADRAGLESTFQECQTQLAQKLKIAPSLPTRELYERLTQVTAAGPSLRTTPFVGRHQEWAYLQRAWEEALQGKPQCLLVTGAAGIGKTRLLTEFVGSVERRGQAVVVTQCHPFTLDVAYTPLLDWLRTPLLRRRMLTLSPPQRAEVAHLLPELRSEQAALALSPPILESWQRQRLYEVLGHLFLSHGEPLLLVIDNVQWCDQGTIDWLHYLFHVAPTAPLLVVGALSPHELRPHYPTAHLRPRLQQSRLVTEVRLEPLTQEGVTALGGILGGQPLSATASAQLYQVTEGNPLYVVEAFQTTQNDRAALTQASSLEAGLLRSPLVQATLQLYFVILSAPALEVLGLAATIGRTFPLDLLAKAALCDRETLLLVLDELLQREIVCDYGESVYSFGHYLLQKAAYATLSSAKRQLWHERITYARQQLGQ